MIRVNMVLFVSLNLRKRDKRFWMVNNYFFFILPPFDHHIVAIPGKIDALGEMYPSCEPR